MLCVPEHILHSVTETDTYVTYHGRTHDKLALARRNRFVVKKWFACQSATETTTSAAAAVKTCHRRLGHKMAKRKAQSDDGSGLSSSPFDNVCVRCLCVDFAARIIEL